MSTFLTENEDDYPTAAATAVPESGDRWGGAGSASATVRGIARMALNRTAWIKKRLARLDADNLFTALSEFRGPVTFTPTQINVPMFVSGITANAAPNPDTNRWQIIGRFKSGGGQYVNIYTGSDGDSRGSFAVTYNAKWDVNTAPAGKWTKYVTGKAATALIWRYTDVRVAGRPAADDTAWEFWNTGPWDTNGTFLSEFIQAGQVLVNSVDYHTPVVRTVPVPITGFRGAARFENDGSVSTVGGTTGQMPPAWQLPCPAGCKFGTITIRHHQEQTDVGDLFEVWTRFSASLAWTQATSLKTADAGVTAGGERITTLHDVVSANLAVSGESVSGTTEYLIVWKIASGGANNRIRSITVERWEPGLRNS